MVAGWQRSRNCRGCSPMEHQPTRRWPKRKRSHFVPLQRSTGVRPRSHKRAARRRSQEGSSLEWRRISRKFEMHGIITSAAEVTHVSKHGFWLLLGNEELLLPFEQFPWFKDATIEQISEVEWPVPDHV